MDLIQKANKLGYKHYTEFTVEELDNLPLGNSNKQIEYYFIQKWLREKHKIHIDLWYNDLTNKWRCECLYLLPLMEVLSVNCNEHPTYEEALEEGLYEALKLVTIK